jgi:outer membrane lipoprotein SlyB
MSGLIGRPAAQTVVAAAPAVAEPDAPVQPVSRPARAQAERPRQLPPSAAAAVRAPAAPAPAAPVAVRPAPAVPAAQPVQVASAPAPAPADGPWVESPRPVVAAADARGWATVESVRTIRTGGEAQGIGAVGGAVLGGVLGHQVGGGTGKKVATVVGALGGGLLGHQVEQRVRGTVRHEATVRLDDGTERTFVRDTAWTVQAGDRVRVVDGTLVTASPEPAVRQVRYGAPSGG